MSFLSYRLLHSRYNSYKNDQAALCGQFKKMEQFRFGKIFISLPVGLVKVYF